MKKHNDLKEVFKVCNQDRGWSLLFMDELIGEDHPVRIVNKVIERSKHQLPMLAATRFISSNM